MVLRQLIIDTETTGLKTEDGHRIIEFAALEMIDRKLTGKSLHLYINPERDIDADASKIHGILNEHLVNKPKITKIEQLESVFYYTSIYQLTIAFLEMIKNYDTYKYRSSICKFILSCVDFDRYGCIKTY